MSSHQTFLELAQRKLKDATASSLRIAADTLPRATLCSGQITLVGLLRGRKSPISPKLGPPRKFVVAKNKTTKPQGEVLVVVPARSAFHRYAARLSHIKNL